LLARVGVAAILAQCAGADDQRVWSEAGQTFGALSAIISSLAIVFTARLQSHERQRAFLLKKNRATPSLGRYLAMRTGYYT